MAFSIARADILVSVGVRRRNGKMSVNLSLFVLLYNTNFMNKLTVYSIICYNLKKFIDLPVQFFFNLQNHPTCHSGERLVNLEGGRECFVGLSILLQWFMVASMLRVGIKSVVAEATFWVRT